MQTASSANLTCSASRSASEYTATVLMPASRQARMIRRAISPRFAISTFLNNERSRLFYGKKPHAQAGSMRKRTWLYSTGLALSTRILTTLPAISDSISFISFIASTMHNTSPGFTV